MSAAEVLEMKPAIAPSDEVRTYACAVCDCIKRNENGWWLVMLDASQSPDPTSAGRFFEARPWDEALAAQPGWRKVCGIEQLHLVLSAWCEGKPIEAVRRNYQADMEEQTHGRR